MTARHATTAREQLPDELPIGPLTRTAPEVIVEEHAAARRRAAYFGRRRLSPAVGAAVHLSFGHSHQPLADELVDADRVAPRTWQAGDRQTP